MTILYDYFSMKNDYLYSAYFLRKFNGRFNTLIRQEWFNLWSKSKNKKNLFIFAKHFGILVFILRQHK